MRVADLMSEPAVTCRRDDTLQQIAERMRDHDVGAVAIVDDDRRLVGIVTDRDICLAACDRKLPLHELHAGAGMTPTVLVCGPDDPVTMAEDMMEANGVRRVAVVDPTGRVLGMLSVDDIAVEGLRELEAGISDPEISPVAVTKVAGTVALPSSRGGRPIPPGSEAMPRPIS